MTAIAAELPRHGLLTPVAESRGVSDEAHSLDELMRVILEDLAMSVSVRHSVESSIDELNLVRSESSEPNWDGYGALAVSEEACANAGRFLRSLPTTYPAPDVAADPDGEIDVTWDYGPKATFSVSIGTDGWLAYAGLFGGNQTFGKEWFSDEIPEAILENLVRLFARVR